MAMIFISTTFRSTDDRSEMTFILVEIISKFFLHVLFLKVEIENSITLSEKMSFNFHYYSRT